MSSTPTAHLAACLASLTLCIGFAAQAQAMPATPGYASVQFSQMLLTAIDLDPLDGQSASITFNGGRYSSYLEIGGYRLPDAANPLGLLPGSGTFEGGGSTMVAPLHTSLGDAQASAFADVTPGLSPSGPFSLSVRAGLALDDVSQVRQDGVQVYLALLPDGVQGTGSTLSLSPHTELRLTGQVDLHADLVTPLAISGPTRGEAHYMAGWGISLSGGTENYYAHDIIDQDFDRDSSSEPVWMTITNDTDQAVDVALAFTAIASASARLDSASAVPEPQTGVLVMAGLALLWGGRQRRRTASLTGPAGVAPRTRRPAWRALHR